MFLILKFNLLYNSHADNVYMFKTHCIHYNPSTKHNPTKPLVFNMSEEYLI